MRWPGDVKVAVNVSGEQLLDSSFIPSVVTALSSSGLPAQRLEIEVTESIFVRDAATAQAIGKVADAVVIGSRIIQLIEDQEHAKVVPITIDFLRGIRKAMDA